MDRFDNVIKGRMDSYESAVPKDMWGKIEAARAVEETGRKKFFFMIATLLLSGTLGYFLLNNNADNALAVNVDKENTTQRATELSSDVFIENKDIESPSQVETTSELSTSDFANSIDIAKESAAAISSSFTHNVIKSKVDLSMSKGATQDILSNKEKSNVTPTASFNSAERNNSTGNSGQLPTTPKTFEIISLSDSEPTFIGEVTQLTKPNNERISKETSRLSAERSDSKRKKLNWKPLIIKRGVVKPIYSKAKIKSNVGCVDFGGNKKKGGISFDIYGGPDIAFKSLNTNSTEHLDFLSAREESESSQLSMHSGIRINRHFKNGLIASGGIMFTQVNEQFKWNKTVGTHTEYTIDIDTITNSTGEMFVVTDTTITTTNTVRSVEAYNKYQFVDVPLTIGFEITNKRLTAGIHAGPMLNMGFYQRGKLLSIQDEDPRSINNPSQDELFKNQLGLGAILRVGIAYNLTEELQIIAESNNRYYLNKTNTSNNPISQSYFVSGFSTGLRIHF